MSFENDQKIRRQCEITLQSHRPKDKPSSRNDLWLSEIRKARATLRLLDERLGYWENGERPPFNYELDREDYDHPDYEDPYPL